MRGTLALGSILLGGSPAAAQQLSLDLGDGGNITGQLIRLVLLLTVLSLAPSILVMVTFFTRIIVVLSFLRSALGLQPTPPNAVLISLALFTTAFIMTPTLERIWDGALAPLIDEQIAEAEALDRAAAPVRAFMLEQVRAKGLELFLDIAGLAEVQTTEQAPIRVLIPTFMISELRRAFYRLPDLHPVPDHRHDRRQCADEPGDDDAVAGAGGLAVQADAVRAGRRLEPAAGVAGGELRDIEEAPWIRNRSSRS
ncbi:MAG TPA: hypothetical protein VFZ01_08940, partial [Geminicoccaceae bacterium]